MIPTIRSHRQMLRAEHAERSRAIRKRLEEFRRTPPGEYGYELMYCLLTPQSSARHAAVVMQKLREANFLDAPFDPEPILRMKDHYIRFHSTKARRLIRLAADPGPVLTMLQEEKDAEKLRDWLVKHVDGFGMKEATHFLRNIGRNGGLAILDRHILRHLVWSGVIDGVPATLSRTRYLEIEQRFKRFARSISIPVDELDLLFWSLQTGEILK